MREFWCSFITVDTFNNAKDEENYFLVNINHGDGDISVTCGAFATNDPQLVG